MIGENVTFEVEIHSDLHRSINWIKGTCVFVDQEPNCNGSKFTVKVMDETVIIMSRTNMKLLKLHVHVTYSNFNIK